MFIVISIFFLNSFPQYIIYLFIISPRDSKLIYSKYIRYLIIFYLKNL